MPGLAEIMIRRMVLQTRYRYLANHKRSAHPLSGFSFLSQREFGSRCGETNADHNRFGSRCGEANADHNGFGSGAIEFVECFKKCFPMVDFYIDAIQRYRTFFSKGKYSSMQKLEVQDIVVLAL